MVKQTIQIFARVKPTKAKTGVGRYKLSCQLDMLWFDFADLDLWIEFNFLDYLLPASSQQ